MMNEATSTVTPASKTAVVVDKRPTVKLVFNKNKEVVLSLTDNITDIPSLWTDYKQKHSFAQEPEIVLPRDFVLALKDAGAADAKIDRDTKTIELN